jgi:hypothetical protein
VRSWLEGIFWRAPSALPAAPASSAAQKYTPRGNIEPVSSPITESSPSDGGQTSSAASIQSHQQGSLITVQQGQRATPDPVGRAESYILFGVQGSRRTLNPGQIRTNNQSTDHSVFQDLKKYYQTHRGRLRIWFSIWRLENCEVVKVYFTFRLCVQNADE